MLRKLRTGKSPSGSFTVYQSDEGWLSVHLLNSKGNLHIHHAKVNTRDHTRIMETLKPYNAFDALSVE